MKQKYNYKVFTWALIIVTIILLIIESLNSGWLGGGRELLFFTFMNIFFVILASYLFYKTINANSKYWFKKYIFSFVVLALLILSNIGIIYNFFKPATDAPFLFGLFLIWIIYFIPILIIMYILSLFIKKK